MYLLISGDLSTNKTDLLIEKYAELLNSGVSSSEILVLVQNSNRKKYFTDKTFEKLKIDSVEKLQIHSFFSLVYNTINDNWAFLENINPYDNPSILPNLAGLEVSQFLLKDILKDIPFKGYNSKKSLLHQIFRRYSLIVQNNLTDEEVEWRSRVLSESFADDTKNVLKKLLSTTLKYRDFDYLRQSLVFNYIYKNTDYFKKIKYLILDDGDEITPICYDFIEYLKPQLKDVCVAYDSKGASRAGYLSADKTAVWKFEKLFNQEPKLLVSENKLKDDAEKIYSNIVGTETSELNYFSKYSPSKRAAMLDEVVKKFNELIGKNVKPSDIAIITPVVDDMLKFSLHENIQSNILFISGNEKLIQNKLVKSVLNILKINNGMKISEFDLRVVLSQFLGIPIKYCKTVLENFEKNRELADCNFTIEEYSEKYNNLKNLLINLKNSNVKLSEKVYEIYNTFDEYYLITPAELNKFNFFIKQIQDFENIFGEEFASRQEEIINQIENSIISENPYSILNITPNDLVVSTPQKIIDNQIKTKYQIWLDISNDEWIKSDTGPLYNAWVFQRGWSKDEYTIEDNIELSKEKTARILRKLTLCASEHIYTYSSLFDSNGIENYGGIEEYIKISDIQDKTLTDKPKFNIIPRDDQKPVLEYTNGKMAISAVPGAGKTTILLALIIKLLDEGINPENIFVMTYMESAARNFRDRIKTIRTNSSQLPNISTIHGLALRIIKENNNYERLGLPADFDICDDTQRTRIIRDLSQKFKLKKNETEEFDRGISVFKMSCNNSIEQNNSDDKKIITFIKFYKEYQSVLKENNLIDYDDILISSVQLLENNKDILNHYQNICQYIIEDEAQDSSAIQQRLINLLSAKHKNLIRCGDINQAITTTFSNADVEGFRKYIIESNNVSMNRSQRCAKDIWQLANKLVDFAKTKPEYKNAFFDIHMNPVDGKNPVSQNTIVPVIFDKPLEEQNYIIKEIKNALKKDPKCTIGILLRYNYQAEKWINCINNSGLKSITRSESLEQKSIFKVIFAIMNIILKPFDNNVVANNYEILAELGLYKQRLGIEIKKYDTPFIEQNCDNIENIHLAQFYWDITYWLSFSYLPPEELAIKIGLHYFSSEIEKSNVYLISTLIKRLNTNNDFESLITRLGELAKRPNLSGFKFFSEEDESSKEIFAGKVQIMTMHKSKGDEFDYVFIPELTEKSLTFDISQIKLKSSEFMENIRRLNPDYKEKTITDMEYNQIAENLRLLYVAITRAKKHLYITTSKKTTSYGKTVAQEPNSMFDNLFINSEVQYE